MPATKVSPAPTGLCKKARALADDSALRHGWITNDEIMQTETYSMTLTPSLPPGTGQVMHSLLGWSIAVAPSAPHVQSPSELQDEALITPRRHGYRDSYSPFSPLLAL